MAKTKLNLPNGPGSALPQLFHLRDPFPYMLTLSRDYKDPMTCPILGSAPIVLTWSPEGIRSIFAADPDTFAPGANEALAVIVGRGSIFMKSGADHKRTRKLLAPPFHGDRMRVYGVLMRETTLRWARELPIGKSVPILPTAQGITLDIIIEAIFGERNPERVKALHHDILAIVEAFNPMIATFRFMQREFGGFGPWSKFRRRAETLQARMASLVAEKREKPGDDILSMLISVRDEDGQPMPEQELFEQLMTFVIAGHETTATSLSWAMYELLRAPAALAKVRDEIAGRTSPEEITKLPYLLAVCQETLRMHPPVPMITRKLAKELQLGEYTLPAGTLVAASAYNAHFLESNFEHPHSFQPERFIDKSYTPFQFLPFGGGARRCLGAAFATYEMQVALATLLSQGDFQLDEPKPVRNMFRIGTYGPETGIRITRLAAKND